MATPRHSNQCEARRLFPGTLELGHLMEGREHIRRGPFLHAVAAEIAPASLEGMHAGAAPGS